MSVVFRGIGKDYGGVTALRGVSAELRKGGVTAVVGRSGSGKSTLVKAVNGLVRPDRGSVSVFGEAIDYGALPALRRRIGYMVQGGGLFPHLNAGDNIGLLARRDGWIAADIVRRRDELLDMVQLPRRTASRYPHELSGGQQQRVSLCRAMMLNPRLLLLDESFAALDPLTRLDIHEELLVLQRRRPRTVLMVTHDMGEALSLADELLLLEGGRLVGRYDTADITAAHQGVKPERLLRHLLKEAAA